MLTSNTITSSDVIKGIRNPRRLLIEINRIYHEKIKNIDRIAVMEEDWDNLIILDACRYDLFENTNSIKGQLDDVISGGSSTYEFLEHNFSDGSYLDTVYASANPQPELHGFTDEFYFFDRLWEEYWDESLRTVPPEITAERTLKAHEQFPNKRLISHFVQPHSPFIGETGQEIDQIGFSETPGNPDPQSKRIWDRLADEEIEKQTVWQAYEENLEMVLPHVERLVNNLEGKTVITSDHGNAFGEMGVYGHPGNRYLDVLVRVPWLECTYDSRKEIVEATDHVTPDEDSSVDVKERLSDLGYMDP